jgi:hypothetical protein
MPITTSAFSRPVDTCLRRSYLWARWPATDGNRARSRWRTDRPYKVNRPPVPFGSVPVRPHAYVVPVDATHNHIHGNKTKSRLATETALDALLNSAVETREGASPSVVCIRHRSEYPTVIVAALRSTLYFSATGPCTGTVKKSCASVINSSARCRLNQATAEYPTVIVEAPPSALWQCAVRQQPVCWQCTGCTAVVPPVPVVRRA